MKTKDSAKFHIVLVNGVIEKKGKYLIAQRSYDEIQAPGKWDLPGGKIDKVGKEDNLDILENTLEKEIEEEVGIKISKNMIYLKSSSFVRVDGASVIKIQILCKWLKGKAKPLEDTIDIAWIEINQFDNYDFCKGVKEAITHAHIKNTSHK